MAARGEPQPDPVEWVRERWSELGLAEPEQFAAAASLMRTHQLVTAQIDAALAESDLSRTAYMLLVTLHLSDGGTRRLSYLARYLMVHQTTVTQMIDQLEGRGLVTRTPHPTDRRTTLAVLTDAGRALVLASTERAARSGFCLGGVDPETVGQLTEALAAVRRSRGDVGER